MLLTNLDEKRAATRTKLIKEVTATDSSGNVHTLFSYNYSLTGIAILSQQNMEIGDVFELKFVIADEHGSSEHQLNAEVVQDYFVGALHVSGMKFEQEIKLH